MSLSEPRIILLQVHTPKAKVLRLAQAVQFHFQKKEKILLFVEDEKAKLYVDECLWKFPENGFLPHLATEEPTQEWIAITKGKNNINQARIAFNLCPTPLFIEGPFRLVYDFEDLTSLHKKNLSSLRFDAYKKANFAIESR